MLQAASTKLFNPLVPNAQNSERQTILLPLQIRPVKVSQKLSGEFLFFAPSALMG